MDIRVDFKGLGSRIRARRKALGMTQAELASLVGLSPNYIGHIERAERIASIQTLVGLGYALDMNIDTMLKDSLPDNGFDESTCYRLRQARCTLANTLTNWVCTDIPDSTGASDAPVDLSLLPPLAFMTLKECASIQSAAAN